MGFYSGGKGKNIHELKKIIHLLLMIHSMELLENCRLEHYIMYESQCNILVYEKNRTGEDLQASGEATLMSIQESFVLDLPQSRIQDPLRLSIQRNEQKPKRE